MADGLLAVDATPELMRLPIAAARVAVTAAWLVTRAALASAQCGAPPPTAPTTPTASPRAASPSVLGRWLDVQQVSLNLRYREQENNEGVVSNNQIQHQQQFRFRFKADSAGHYAVNFGAFTGNGFGSGWNNTGIGTGEYVGYLVFKQLFVAAEPIAGVEVQAGSLYVWRGESSEVTTYDNDAYMTGYRASVRRPAQVFFDEVTYAHANLDSAAPPNSFRRFDRMDDPNYRQIGVMKSIGKLVGSSFELASLEGVESLRAALEVRTPEWRAIDSFVIEFYNRVNGPNPAGGFAVTADKAVLKNALVLHGGFSKIDPLYAPPNGDRYLQGNHLFGRATWTLSREWTVQGFVTRAVKTDFTISTGTRVDVLLQYSAVPLLRRFKLIS